VNESAKTNLLDFDQQALKDFFAQLGEKPFRTAQVMRWIYHQGVTDYDAMTDLSNKLREHLKAETELALPEVSHEQVSADGTTKWLFDLDSGNGIESVFIPETARGTLCISSQVGCALDCSFCATARQGFNRNLSTAEIVGQIWQANQRLGGGVAGSRRITNIVLMGMGEPLLNYKNLIPALKLMMQDQAFGFGKRRVTVSTAGVVPAMDRLKEDVDVSLAVSLHAPTDDLRDELVPLNKKYPIDELMAACKRFVATDRKKHITFEYVMLAGVNDSDAEARELVRCLRGVSAKINLIPFNTFEGNGYHCSSQNRIDRFRDILYKGGLNTVTRKTRGEDIDAACGQLAGKVADRSRREVKFVQPRFGEQS